MRPSRQERQNVKTSASQRLRTTDGVFSIGPIYRPPPPRNRNHLSTGGELAARQAGERGACWPTLPGAPWARGELLCLLLRAGNINAPTTRCRYSRCWHSSTLLHRSYQYRAPNRTTAPLPAAPARRNTHLLAPPLPRAITNTALPYLRTCAANCLFCSSARHSSFL